MLALGRCVKRIVNGVTNFYIYDGEKPILEYSSAGAIIGRNLYGKAIDEILMRTDPTAKAKEGSELIIDNDRRVQTGSVMARPLRIQYGGARYHIMSRGDRREAIFHVDGDRTEFLRTLGQTCAKTAWQVHAYCLMTNHFHLVVETPQPNLALGMKWLLGTYTQRFNRRHRHWGHLFGGRYKAQLIDERSPGYLRCACDYVHLNPVRAGIVAKDERLESFRWSSYPAYRRPKLRPPWLRVDRVLSEHGLEQDTAASRREFERRMKHARLEQGDQELLRRGWKIGAEDFRDWLADKLARRGRKGERAKERSETDTVLAERMVGEALAAAHWREIDLTSQPKGHAVKVKIAQQLRTHTPMNRQWIANRLKIGSASYVSTLLNRVDNKL